MVNKRYIGRKVINGIVMNQESFIGLRRPNVPSLTDDIIYGSLNESDDRHQMYFCNDDNVLGMRVGYDDAGITGIEGICSGGSTTAKYGTILEDGTNSKVIPINNNKIIVGSRDYNKNYQTGIDDVFKKSDGTEEGQPYDNTDNGELLRNYVHEFAPFESQNSQVVIDLNNTIGNEKDLFYVTIEKF